MTTRRIKYGSTQKLFVNNKELFFCPPGSIISLHSSNLLLKWKLKQTALVFITARMTVMKHIKFLILSSVSMFLFVSVVFVADVFAANPHFTPMSLLPQPFASTSSLKVAGIYWLPDYLKGNVSRGSEDKGGGDIDGNCEKNYGMHTPSNIDGRYICSK